MTQTFRTGAPLGRTIWLQIEDHPGPLDIYLGVMDADELATQVVNALNRPPEPPPAPPGPEPTLAQEISMVLNRHSRENLSNTPDYILAKFLLSTLTEFETAVKERDHWYGIAPSPGWLGIAMPPEVGPDE